MRFQALIVTAILLVCVSLALAFDNKRLMPVEPLNPGAVSAEKVELGKILFFDRRLSGDGTMSCASCHLPEMAFTDGQDISLSYPTTKNWRNAPTLINIAYMKTLFHDGRSSSLSEQALFPIGSPFEMNQNLQMLEEELESVPEYKAMFEGVFGPGAITAERISEAIAEYERTILSIDSPLDRYLKGDSSALSKEARLGFELFMGKARCIECHYGVNLTDGDFHNLGVPENPKLLDDPRVTATMRYVAKTNGHKDYARLTEDPGRYLVTKKKNHWKAFRTPGLREVAQSAPYMHNGAIKTLDEVIDFFDHGGGPGPSSGSGKNALKPLGLSDKEKAALKAFMVEGLAGAEIQVKYPRVP